MSGFVVPVTLTGGRWVSLEPLRREHVSEIAAASADGDVGSLWYTGAPSPQTAEQWVDMRLELQKPDTGLTFVVRRHDGTADARSGQGPVVELPERERAQPQAGDRQHLVWRLVAPQRN